MNVFGSSNQKDLIEAKLNSVEFKTNQTEFVTHHTYYTAFTLVLTDRLNSIKSDGKIMLDLNSNEGKNLF